MKILVRTLMDGHYIRTVMDAHERWVNVGWMMGGRWMDDGWTLSRNSRILEKLGTRQSRSRFQIIRKTVIMSYLKKCRVGDRDWIADRAQKKTTIKSE